VASYDGNEFFAGIWLTGQPKPKQYRTSICLRLPTQCETIIQRKGYEPIAKYVSIG
jgi:hypothetical protein